MKKFTLILVLASLILSCSSDDGNSPTQVNYETMYPTGTVFCNNVVTAVVDVTNPVTGKTWMDRNLGASQVATSSKDAAAYGDLYQWGRRADGHQCRNSATTSTLSSSDQPSHGFFIVGNVDTDDDWLAIPNNNLWQGVNGINNPCPSSYRLPTEAELNSEILSWTSMNAVGAFASQLKIPLAGFRQTNTNEIYDLGQTTLLWSSTISVIPKHSLTLILIADNLNINFTNAPRNNGFSVRCIKD